MSTRVNNMCLFARNRSSMLTYCAKVLYSKLVSCPVAQKLHIFSNIHIFLYHFL